MTCTLLACTPEDFLSLGKLPALLKEAQSTRETAIFSKNAILKGSFDKYATDKKGKRGTAGRRIDLD
jgi:hypothetical protein